MQLPQKLLIFEFLKGFFGEIGFTHGEDGFVEGRPIDFLEESFDVVEFELAFPVDGLLDLDNEGEVVLVALGDVADEQVMRK